MDFFYHLLENPTIYKLSQVLLGPGAEKTISKKIANLNELFPGANLTLDVGCGPSSWLWKVGCHPIGLDISFPYSVAYRATGETAITGSATELPFADNAFDGVWTIGVLHHLPESEARLMVQEMHRVCKIGCYVVVFDAVLPLSLWRRPLAYLVRKLDRGRFMRTQPEIEGLLPAQSSWSINRFTYTLNGLEMLICWNKKTA